MLRKMFAVMAVSSIMVAGCGGEAPKKKEEPKKVENKMEPAKDAKPAEKK
jgi:hypothetical protein